MDDRALGFRALIRTAAVAALVALAPARPHVARAAEQPLPIPQIAASEVGSRSEERRVGKECRSRWSPYH